jgi:ribonucleotide monophosphatase NagD (HAD superfamily)
VTPAERFITGASAAARHTAEAYPGRSLFVISPPDALREFDGQRLLEPDEVEAAGPGEVAAVVIGDGGEALSYRNLDVAFRAIRRGADLVAMHRNPWWLTPRGETIDAGAWVVALEYATGRTALVCGKPSPVVFRQAVAGLAADIGLADLPADAVAMIGDDPEADVAGAKRAGLRGILVLTGKVDGPAAHAAIAGQPVADRPDAIAPSLADVVAALPGG